MTREQVIAEFSIALRDLEEYCNLERLKLWYKFNLELQKLDIAKQEEENGSNHDAAVEPDNSVSLPES